MNTEVKVNFIRSDGKQLLCDNTDFKIISLDGIDSPENTIFSQNKAVGDGIEITGMQATAKDFVLTCKTTNAYLNDIFRKRLLAFFNIKYDYKIYVTYLGNTRWCEAKLYKPVIPSLNIFKTISFTVQFIRAEAYWKSVDEFAKDIASVEARYGYPLYDIENVGFVYDLYNFAKNVLIENDGDTECYCVAVIEAKAEVVNPKLIKNEKYVRILDTLKAGDTYIIDFVNVGITKNGENAIKNVDKTSNFTQMQFDIGSNVISFGADIGENVLKVTIYFNKLYGGV